MPIIGNAFVFTVLDTFRRTDSQSWFRYLRSESDEKNWSSSYLREQFKEKGLEYLFDKYRSRIQQSTFTLALMITILYSIARLISIFTIDKVNYYRPSAIMYGFAILLSFILLLFVCVHTVNWKWKIMHYFMSIVILIIWLVADYIFIVYNWQVSQSPRLSPTFIVILVTYVFLPFPHYYGATLAGFIITMLELLISGFMFYSKIGAQFKDQLKVYPLTADCIFLLACNAVGVYKLYIDEVNQRRAFLDRRMCIESQIKCLIEEEREDHLLSTVLPRHIITDVKRDIRGGILSSDMRPTNHWPFSELYVVQYTNVSIMFADIVNFTKLASNLTSENLVVLLDELFGRFDAIAEKHNCMRIRIVGDCYIAVCGIPDYLSNHANNCVEMGFEMIQTIKEIREERRMNIDMRIGIHSGKVISGILGVKKWQFDIWSQDVDIANLMEHTGQSGKIHISKVVKDLLGDGYEYEPGFGETKSPFLTEKKITTFLVIDKFEKEETLANGNMHCNGQIRLSMYQPNISHSSRSIRYQRIQRRENQLDNSVNQFGSSSFQSSNVNIQMERAIDRMALRKKDQWTKDTGIDPLTLRFSSIVLELPFMRQIDPLYKYYLLAILLIFITLLSMNTLTNTAANKYLSFPYLVLVIPLLALVYAAWHDFVINVKIDSNEGSSLPQAPKGRLNSFLTLISRNVASSLKVRLCLWLTVTVILTFLIVINMFYTYSFALAVTSIAVFLRIHHMFKLVAYITVLLIFVIFFSIFDDDCIYESFFPGEYVTNRFPVDHSIYLIFVIVCHHLMDRQFEYLSRLDYLWKCQLRQKQEETNITNTVNKFLIQNILPQHVATFYMDEGTKTKVYHEEYTHVAVMFASIPNFSEFYEETDINGHGLKCLQLLNEIICELDCLLNVTQFSRVEKIKVISSTYMVAAGLKPSRRPSNSDENIENLEPLNVETNVVTLVDLAYEMINILDRLNKNALQEFQFRIGIEYGCISAGVVGAKKPLYDIWGDTVNIASRMESTGVVGKIQVTEKVARVLLSAGYTLDCRGDIYVKGKDQGFVTYLLTSRPSESAVNLPTGNEAENESVCESTYL